MGCFYTTGSSTHLLEFSNFLFLFFALFTPIDPAIPIPGSGSYICLAQTRCSLSLDYYGCCFMQKGVLWGYFLVWVSFLFHSLFEGITAQALLGRRRQGRKVFFYSFQPSRNHGFHGFSISSLLSMWKGGTLVHTIYVWCALLVYCR